MLLHVKSAKLDWSTFPAEMFSICCDIAVNILDITNNNLSLT